MIEFIKYNSIEITFIICGMLGGIMHYIKKFVKGETDAKLTEWFGSANIITTLYTVIVFFFAIVGAIAAGVINSETAFWAAMYSGFVTGFAVDSGFNSDASSLNKTLIEQKSDLNVLFGETKTKTETKTLINTDKPTVKTIDPERPTPRKK